jgi:protein-glutamine gamma-glutamyltransferase
MLALGMASAATTAPPTTASSLPAVQRYFEISLFLLVATGVLSIVSTGKLDIISVLIPSVALIYKGIRMQRGRGPEITHRAATGLVLGYFLFFPIDLWVLSRGLSEGAPNPPLYAALLASIHLILFATLVRLYSAQSNRDYAFLTVLAVASMLVSAILTVETSFLIALAIFLVLSVSTFVALEMRRSSAGAVSPAIEPRSTTARQLNRALGFTSLLVAASVLAVGVLLFFLIPRVTTGYLSSLSLQPGLLTGFSDNVALGQIGEIKQNPAVVMRIKIDGDPGRAADMHWRGIVLTNFTGNGWTTPSQNQKEVEPNESGEYIFDLPKHTADRSNLLHYTVLMEPIATDAIFVAPPVQSLVGKFGMDGMPTRHAGASRTFLLPAGGMANRGFIYRDRTDSLFNPTRNNTKMRYEGIARLSLATPMDLRNASKEVGPEIGGDYLQLPPQVDPRIRALAASITAKQTNDYDKAAEMRRYLIAHYSYTLNLTGPTGKSPDPLAYFLFTSKAGHCEYFATAMTVMLRAVGVPARYVTGFLPGEYNDVGGDYIIRGSDAHAWVEVYFEGYGWITFDPTPPSNEPHGFLSRFGLYWDWFQLTWNEWFINYDFSHQMTLGKNVHDSTRTWNDHLRAFYHRQQQELIHRIMELDRKTEGSRYFLPGVLGCLVAALLLLRGGWIIRFAVARWRLRARGGNLTASLASYEYAEMLRLLEKRGWIKSEAQTPLEFAAAIPAASDVSMPVARLTELYQSARFGSQPAPAGQMSALLSAIRDAVTRRRSSRQ